MADDSNIDEILKSIDALLKEGESQDQGHDDSGKPRSDAANSEESLHEHPEESGEVADSGDVADGQVDQHAGDEEEPGAGTSEDVQPEEQPEMDEAEGRETDDDSEPDTGEAEENQPRRIVLSESMLVEDTPDLLDFAGQQADEGKEDDSEAAPADEQATPQGVEAIDMDELVEKISDEITARLHDKLPKLVAKSVRKHLAAQLEKTDGKAD